MSIREFYNDTKKKYKNNELASLYKKPVHETREDMPVTQVFEPNVYYEADLLYMPEDNKFKYILVVVDVHDRKIDCEPLTDRSSEDIVKGFKDIFKRKILKPPKIIMLDKGSEFQGKTPSYLHSVGVQVKQALTGRHRQLAMVERANQKIGKIFFQRMASQELLTGEQDKHWVDDLKELVEVFNEHRAPPTKTEISPDPIASEYSGNLLKIGSRVRVQLDHPVDTVKNNRLIGTFRATDIRWSPEIHRVEQVLLKPGFPPMYLIDGDHVARTKQQLQVVKESQKAPDPKYIRGNPEHYIINKIMDVRRNNRRQEEFLVNWKGYPHDQDSWISGKEFDRTADLKAMKREFKENN